MASEMSVGLSLWHTGSPADAKRHFERICLRKMLQDTDEVPQLKTPLENIRTWCNTYLAAICCERGDQKSASRFACGAIELRKTLRERDTSRVQASGETTEGPLTYDLACLLLRQDIGKLPQPNLALDLANRLHLLHKRGPFREMSSRLQRTTKLPQMAAAATFVRGNFWRRRISQRVRSVHPNHESVPSDGNRRPR